MITNIASIAIYVENQEAAQEFWIKKVGFKTTVEDQMSPHQFWIEVAPSQDSQTRLLIYSYDMMLEEGIEVCHPNIVFECDEIDLLYKRLKENGVEVGSLENRNFGLFFEMKDLEGNSYVIREKKYFS